MSSSNSLKNNEVLVADAGPLLALARIECLPLLGQLFSRVLVTETVLHECCAKPDRADAQQVLAMVEASNLQVVADPRSIRQGLQHLDDGEQTALELALQCSATVLMDERKGRAIARSHHLKVIGVPGVLLLARQQGLVPTLKPLLELLVNSGYYLSETVIAAVLSLAGECCDT